MPANNTIRTFIACPIPMEISTRLLKLQDQLSIYNWKVKWVPVSNIHITLSFLGDIQSSMQKTITQAIQPLIRSQKPFELSLGNLGVFPGVRRPNVLWVGLTGEIQSLIIFQNKLEGVLKPLGYIGDKRNYKAHLTVGRIKGPVPKNQLAKVLCLDISKENQKFICDRLVFYQSILSPKGAQYSVLHEWHFNL